MIAVSSRRRDRLAVFVYIDDNVLSVHSNINHIGSHVCDDILAFPVLMLMRTYNYCQTTRHMQTDDYLTMRLRYSKLYQG